VEELNASDGRDTTAGDRSMIRIAVTGSECTGKTVLANELARHYGAVVVPEYVRLFVEDNQRAPEASDVETIALGQLELERARGESAHKLLLLDTDLLSTMIYSHHYYGDCPTWIEQTLVDRPADLYLLCGIDVPWVPDGDQRDRGDRREEMQQLFRVALIDRGLAFIEVRGSVAERVDLATRAIDKIVALTD
jgi:NadR type nicotinamide-nucleotide adenylyltransferase